MKKTILTFGLISGVISSILMLCTLPFADDLGHGVRSALIGYTGMVLAFLLVYFGIRSFRDNLAGGVITFRRGFVIGISITLISCCFYVLTWEILYFHFMHNFMDNYNAHVLDQARAAGASAAALQAKAQALAKFKQSYENPFFNSAVTFVEPFPVGFLITLISAGLLRRKSPIPSTKAAVA